MADPLEQVTPLILTYNEEANIARSLAGLRWAQRIVVVDSGSTDRTLELLAAAPQVEVVQRPFDSFADQCNFGLGLIRTIWCLSLDADHVITAAFQAELALLIAHAPTDLAAVVTPFCYLVAGKPLRGTLLPPRINLMRPSCGHYENDGHSHQFVPIGRTTTMREPVLHDDRKPLSRWLWAQERYHWLEAEKLLQASFASLGFTDRLRKYTPFAPLVAILYCLFIKRGLLDAQPGLIYALQRGYAELQIWLMLQELRRQQELPV